MATTPAQMASKWQQGFSQAGPAWTAGVNGVQQSPMAAAAAQSSKALSNYSASINSGAWAAALNAVPLSTWKSQCQKASANLSTGAQKGLAKYTAWAQTMPPVYAQMKSAAQSATTPQAKVVAALNVMIASGKKGKAAGMTA